MKRCPGVPLSAVIRTLSAAEKQKVLQELRGYFDELRALEPPQPGKVGSTNYGPLDNFRLSRSPCGPFENVVEFHRASRDGLENPTGVTEVDDMIAAQECRDYSVKFTHGDIAWRHIYYADGKITSIIDWGYAGWYPGYWEYAMTWHSFMDCPNLRDDIPVILDAFPEELKMEQARKGLLVDYGRHSSSGIFEASSSEDSRD